MSQIPPLTVIEPVAGQRRAAGIVARKESRLDLESIKTELGEIRRHCRDNETSLMEKYKNNLSQFSGVEWTVALDAAQAASYIKQVAGRTDLVSINKSNVVVNELRPQLQAVGLETYVRYFEDFDTFENKVEDYGFIDRFQAKPILAAAIRRVLNTLPVSIFVSSGVRGADTFIEIITPLAASVTRGTRG